MNSKWLFLGFFLILTIVIQESACKSTKSEDEGDRSESEKDSKESDESKSKEESGEDKASSEQKEVHHKKSKNPLLLNKCQGHKLEPPTSLFKAQKKCEDEKKKSKEGKKEGRKSGPTCCAVCFWTKMEFFSGENHKLDSSAVEDFIEVMFTGQLQHGQAIMKKEWKDCKKLILDADEDDHKCKRHKAYFKCILKSFTTFCNKQPTKLGGIVLTIG